MTSINLRNLILTVTAILFVFVALSSEVHAADSKNMKFSARVKVYVWGNDNIQDTVSSYIKRELRSLNDVELVDSDSEWEINVGTAVLDNVNGYNLGVLFSTLIIHHFDNWMLSYMLQPKYKDEGMGITSNLSYSGLSHEMKWGSMDNLQEKCKKIVTDFDTHELEASRKSFRQLKESLQKSQK